ncbi:DNA methyltransferase [Actinotignum sanguinis]|uniref:DNA methyltransferase n=1 Tax=Actinotignum sanguinis TaxID=1445614 RepID=UPI002934C984|nr:DNA methyltransferase [Actinotignum sanguinis]MDV2437736.1 DNA methyltransferase [Actinotignum sanguinis]
MAISSRSRWTEFSKIPVDRDVIPQIALDIGAGRRTNALPWRGQFSPDFVANLLDFFEPQGLVVDPFCGSGTTLVEASRLGLPTLGVEVNAAAYLLARVYAFAEVSQGERSKCLESMIAHTAPAVLSGDSRVLRDAVLSLVEPLEQILASAVFLLALGNGHQFSPDSWQRGRQTVEAVLEGLGEGLGSVQIELGDARRLPLEKDAADLVLTSPPYVNVFNYHQNYRSAVELLGFDVLPPARAEIGSNRKFRQNRFLTVVQYAQDSGLALNEATRVLRPGGYLVWVVGRESNVRGVPILNSQISYDMASQVPGLVFCRRFERKFRSRYGALVFEDILVFRRLDRGGEASPEDLAESGRRVGIRLLKGLEYKGGDIVSREIDEAVARAGRVAPSPLAHCDRMAK